MSKKKSRKLKADKRAVSSKRKLIVVLITIAALTLTGVLMAQHNTLKAIISPISSPAPVTAPAPVPQSQPQLAKEYVYAGGRLIATEEPTSSAPVISDLDPELALPGQSFILTITGNNLSGASSVNFNPPADVTVSNVTSVSNTQVTTNVTINNPATAIQRNVSVTVGSQTSGTLPFTINNHVPVLSSITPTTAQAGSSTPIALTVFGTGFVSGSIIRIRPLEGISSSDLTTNFVSTTKLTASILPQHFATPGIKKITVFTPTPGGGTSGEKDLNVSGGTLIPVANISSISPTSLPVGSSNLTLTLNSSNGTFRNGAVVRVNGSNRLTNYHNDNLLTATLIAADVASPTPPKNITVLNPGGVQPSNSIELIITGGGSTTGTGLKGEYFNNKTLTGPPVLTRNPDPIIDFNWVQGSPAPQVSTDNFSIRWTGQIKAPTTGNYTFYSRFNDGVRLFIGNDRVFEYWKNQSEADGIASIERSGSKQLTAGQLYNITLEYYENTGKASLDLSWSLGTSIPKQKVPTSQLYPPPASPPQPFYQGVHEGTDCTAIYGWAADANQPNTSINIDIFHGTTFLATVAANQPKTGVPVAGNHGFSYTVPASLKDGQSRTIWVRYSGTTSNLTGSPKTLMCSVTPPPPSMPTNLTANLATPSQINLAWTNISNEDGYKIERKQGAGGTYTEIGSTGRDVVSYQDLSSFTPGATYFYRVRSYNTTGHSAYSNEPSVPIPGASGGPPAAPSNLVVTPISSTSVSLSWTDNSNNETGFRVRRKKVATCSSDCAETSGGTTDENDTSHTNTGLSPSTLYCYRVEAYNSSGSSSTGYVCATTLSGSSAALSVSLFSGDGSIGSNGYREGPGATAKWRSPGTGAVGIDPVSGLNALFVADTENHRIRMVYLEGPVEGHSILLAGSGIAGSGEGGGDPFAARYNYPRGIAVIKNEDDIVDAILIADTDNHTIRMLLPPLGGIQWRPETFSGKFKADYVDGNASVSCYNAPYGITIGNDGFIYIADSANGAIRTIDWDGNSSTFLQRNTWKSATFTPIGITSSAVSNWLYITSHNSNSINRVEGDVIEILSSSTQGYQDGNGTQSRFNTPYHMIWSDSGGLGSLYIVDQANNRIRRFDLQASQVSTIAGSGTAGYQNGTVSTAKFQTSTGIAIGSSSELYVIETGNHGVRKISEQ
jgi:hypothetical protein